MKLEIVLFPFCPYGHRARIALEWSGLPHQVVNIDPRQPPDWFPKASPLGKVPLLRIDESTSVFESAVICELVNDLGNLAMLPSDPVARAVARAWIEYASACQGTLGEVIKAADPESCAARIAELQGMLTHLETATDATGPYFLGATPSLVDVSLAPLFTRMNCLNAAAPCLPGNRLPKIQALIERLQAQPEVMAAVDGRMNEVFHDWVKRLGGKGHVASRLELG